MIAVWLARAAVATEPLPDALPASPLDTLLEEAPAPPPTVHTLAELPAGPDLAGLWPFGLAAGVAGLWLVTRRKRLGRGAELTIVSRTAVSSQSALVLVDVADPDGRAHRLLVGIGSGRPPSLVADLGMAEDPDDDLETANDVDLPSGYPAYRGQANVNSVPVNRELLESPTLPNLHDPSRAGRKAQAQALISEIVEERRTAMVRP